MICEAQRMDERNLQIALPGATICLERFDNAFRTTAGYVFKKYASSTRYRRVLVPRIRNRLSRAQNPGAKMKPVSSHDSSEIGKPVAVEIVSLDRSHFRVLMVDLNNFAAFPTLAIGLLVAALRNEGHEVRLICPLAYDVPAFERERCERLTDHLKRRLHLSTWPPLRKARDCARRASTWWSERPHRRVAAEVARELKNNPPDVILLSAYLMHRNSVQSIAKQASCLGIPVVLGGPLFNVSETAGNWSQIPGITAVVGSESDRTIGSIVAAVCNRTGLEGFPGVVLPDGTETGVAPPLRNLDDTPFADFSDFPWDRYPVRIAPLMTGRGCQWNRCRFCSDIVSVSGRSFRTRSVSHVLAEMQEQSRRHGLKSFVFLDLKLNSYPDMMRGIASKVQQYVPGAEWVGTVHVDERDDNGLSRADLKSAVAGGMRRISFGLESGSQRMLDLIDKGCTVERNAAFLRNAHEAGLSVRCTMFKGYPGETARDMELTASFLEQNAKFIDRIRFNEFSLIEDTPIYKEMTGQSNKHASSGSDEIEIVALHHNRAKAQYINHGTTSRDYRKAKAKALDTVYRINRKAIRSAARQFDGLM